MRNSLTLVFVLGMSFVAALGSAEAPPGASTRDEIKSAFGFVPGFLDTFPEAALPGAWDELKGFELNPNTALPLKLKHAIGLAVAAQAGCSACVYAHRQFAKQDGASDAELNEAVLMAALTRHWSTVFHGLQLDLARFKSELATSIEHVKKLNEAPPKDPAPSKDAVLPVTDAKGAREDIARSFGSVPEYMQRFPDEAIVGAWKEERAIEMSPSTALSGKQKSLISLAVSSQIPCRFCILADTEFAKLAGASEREIAEAIASAAIARHWATYLSGIELDDKAFRKDIDRIVNASHKTAVALARPQPQKRVRSAARH